MAVEDRATNARSHCIHFWAASPLCMVTSCIQSESGSEGLGDEYAAALHCLKKTVHHTCSQESVDVDKQDTLIYSKLGRPMLQSRLYQGRMRLSHLFLKTGIEGCL